MENFQNTRNHSKSLSILGFGLFKFFKKGSGWEYDTIFQKGMSFPFIQNVFELCKNEIIEKREGNSIIPLDDYSVIIHYFNKVQSNNDIIVAVYMDQKDSDLNYSKLYILTKKISRYLKSGNGLSEAIQYCDETIQIPKAKNMIAIFIIGATGSPYLSKVNKSRTSIAKSEVHISGFISALYSFSREIIGEDSGAKLKEINFGNQHFYMITKNQVIFAFLVEKINPLLKRYMYIIVEKFMEEYEEDIQDFRGEVTLFGGFEDVIDQYFII